MYTFTSLSTEAAADELSKSQNVRESDDEEGAEEA